MAKKYTSEYFHFLGKRKERLRSTGLDIFLDIL